MRGEADIRVGVSFRAADELCPGGVADLLGHARLAERLGFDDFDAADHLVLVEEPEGHPGAIWDWSMDSLWPDPLIALAAIAGSTTRIGLTTSVLIAPLRPAVVVAKMAATLDAMSGGRLTLGLGTGWMREEFAAAGVPFERRGARLEDLIGACRALWSGSPATFSSSTVSFDGVWCSPRPARPDGPPILLGGAPTPRLADRIARLAQGWLAMGRHRDQLGEAVAALRAAFERHGRDPAELSVRAPVPEAVLGEALRRRDPDLLREEVAALAALGVTDTKVYVHGLIAGPAEVEPTLAWIAAALGLASVSHQSQLVNPSKEEL